MLICIGSLILVNSLPFTSLLAEDVTPAVGVEMRRLTTYWRINRMSRHITLYEPPRTWQIIRGESQVLARGKSLRDILRDTIIPGEDTRSVFVVAPNGLRISLSAFVALANLNLTANLT